MPTTTDRSDVRARVFEPGGAGGEPLGEPPATPPRTPRRSRLSSAAVEDAVERARLREMVKRPDGERISDEVIDELLAGARTEEEIAGPGGLLAELTKRLVERAMEVELTDHVGYEPHCEPPGGAENTRNGTSPKTLITEHGKVEIDAPRDRKFCVVRDAVGMSGFTMNSDTPYVGLSLDVSTGPVVIRLPPWSRSAEQRSATSAN